MVEIRESRRKIKWPELSELEQMIQQTSQVQVALSFGLNHVSVHKHIKRERKRLEMGYVQTKRTTCRDCDIVLDEENSYRNKRPTYCKKCQNRRKTESLRQRKREIVVYLGGECVMCGYKKYVGALHIHHKDPSMKDFNFRHIKGWSWSKVVKELENCELLCANCHSEVHAQDY